MFMLTFSFNNENKDDDDGDSGDDGGGGGLIPGIRFPVDSVIFRPVVPGVEPKK